MNLQIKRYFSTAVLSLITAFSFAQDLADRYQQGIDAHKAADYASAEKHFQYCAEQAPDTMAYWYALAAVQRTQGKHSDALKSFQECDRINPNNPKLIGYIAQSYDNIGETEKAVDHYIKAIKLEHRYGEPNTAKNACDIGISYYNDSQTEHAEKLFKAAIELDAKYGAAYYYLGMCQLNDGRNAEAKKSLNQFLELDPDHSEASTAKEMLQYMD